MSSSQYLFLRNWTYITIEHDSRTGHTKSDTMHLNQCADCGPHTSCSNDNDVKFSAILRPSYAFRGVGLFIKCSIFHRQICSQNTLTCMPPAVTEWTDDALSRLAGDRQLTTYSYSACIPVYSSLIAFGDTDNSLNCFMSHARLHRRHHQMYIRLGLSQWSDQWSMTVTLSRSIRPPYDGRSLVFLVLCTLQPQTERW